MVLREIESVRYYHFQSNRVKRNITFKFLFSCTEMLLKMTQQEKERERERERQRQRQRERERERRDTHKQTTREKRKR